MKIEAIIHIDELNNINYRLNFEVIDELPKVGENYNGEEVLEILEVSTDCNQQS